MTLFIIFFNFSFQFFSGMHWKFQTDLFCFIVVVVVFFSSRREWWSWRLFKKHHRVSSRTVLINIWCEKEWSSKWESRCCNNLQLRSIWRCTLITTAVLLAMNFPNADFPPVPGLWIRAYNDVVWLEAILLIAENMYGTFAASVLSTYLYVQFSTAGVLIKSASISVHVCKSSYSVLNCLTRGKIH